jgi:DNA polymerase III alpha subunit
MTPEDFEKLKEKLKKGYIKQIGSDNGFENIWESMQSASKYSFNSSHALSYAYDSIYCAYLKSHYPIEYYTTVLNMYSGNTEETDKIIKELPYFNININPIKFRHSRAEYSFDKFANVIYKGIKSIKYMNKQIADELFELGKKMYSSFVNLLVDIIENTSVNTRQLEILIKLNFFKEFGENQYLLNIYNKFIDRYKKTYVEKTKQARLQEISEYIKTLNNEYLPIKEQLLCEQENLGYIQSIYPDRFDETYFVVLETDIKYSPKLHIRYLATGIDETIKIPKGEFKQEPLKCGDIVKVGLFEQRQKSIKDGIDEKGKPIFKKVEGQYEKWLVRYFTINN